MFDANSSNYIGVFWNQTSGAPAGEWYHLVATYDGSSATTGITIYLNGSAISTGADSGGSYTAMEAGSHDLLIGMDHTNKTFAGWISDLSVWSAELSSEDARALYQAQDAYYSKGPDAVHDLTGTTGPIDLSVYSKANSIVSWWRFGDYSGDSDASCLTCGTGSHPSGTFYDASGNSHTAYARIGAKSAFVDLTSSHGRGAGIKRSYTAVVTGTIFDNAYMTYSIPRTDQQYSWITKSVQ